MTASCSGIRQRKSSSSRSASASGLRKQHARLADDTDMMVRAFVPDALKAKGLDVRSGDLMDLRNERR